MERIRPTNLQMAAETLMAIVLLGLSYTPDIPIRPDAMPEAPLSPKPTSMASSGTIYFNNETLDELILPSNLMIKSQPGQDKQETKDIDPNVIETPEGRFRLTDKVMTGAGSVYSRDFCLGCRSDFIMANGEELKDDVPSVATPPEFDLNSRVLVKTADSWDDPTTIRTQIFKVTDRGGFMLREFKRPDQGNQKVIIDLSSHANHLLVGEDGSRGVGRAGVEVIALEPIDPDPSIPDSPSTSSPGWDDEASE